MLVKTLVKKSLPFKGTSISKISKISKRYLKNGVSKSIVHMIKCANFQLYSVQPDRVIYKPDD